MLDAVLGRLRRTRIHTGGPAFWRSRDLMVLLIRLRRDGTPSWSPEEDWIHNIEAHEALNIRQTEDITRQLVYIEQSFFAELNDLHWDIRYEIDDDQTDLGGVGRSLSHILHSSRCLKKIHVTFSQDTAFQDLSDSSYWPRAPDLTDTSSQQFRLRPDIYKWQQAASGAWLRPSEPRSYSFEYLQAVTLSVVTIEQDLWAFLSKTYAHSLYVRCFPFREMVDQLLSLVTTLGFIGLVCLKVWNQTRPDR
jgi:hypothetical protein